MNVMIYDSTGDKGFPDDYSRITDFRTLPHGNSIVAICQGNVVDVLSRSLTEQHAPRVGSCQEWVDQVRSGNRRIIWPPGLAGLAILRAVAYAGLKPSTLANQVEERAPGRIHIVSYGVGSAEPGSLFERRLRGFTEAVAELRPGSRIPWELLEPASWPENLVSIYLLLKSLALSPPDRRSQIADVWHRQAWRGRVWAAALDEYVEAVKGGPQLWHEAGLPEISDDGTVLDGELGLVLERLDAALDAIRGVFPSVGS